MLKLIMVRHAEPDYTFCDERGFIGHGWDLAPLTAEGIEQAEKTAKDERLKGAEIIITSPYTRALQTAAIISRSTGIKLFVDIDLREWQPDLTFQYKAFDECLKLCGDYDIHNGKYPEGETRRWEQTDDVKKRVNRVLEQYTSRYQKIIMVSHGMVMRTVYDCGEVGYAGIIECEI